MKPNKVWPDEGLKAPVKKFSETFSAEGLVLAEMNKRRQKPKPSECPHCEYDRRFPGFEAGGWMQMDNNGPIVSCPWCNDDCSHPRQ